ncbi:hypothetical protein MRY87_11760 [bacterium]|nr:hypothetical protein [bacterium]
MSKNSRKAISFDVDALDMFGATTERGTPERNLLMAILERAILDFVGNDQREVRQAEEWLFEEEQGTELAQREERPIAPFSFAWVCQQLDLDIRFILQTIKDMPKRGTRRVAPWYFMNRAAS